MSKILSYDNKIYYVKNDSLIQYVSINFNYGSINDKIGGEAHLLEHIVGTYLSQIIKKNNVVCNWDAFTNYQNTCFTFNFLKNEYNKFEQIIVPAIFSLNKVIIDDILKNEINVVKEEIGHYKTQYFNKLLEKSMKHYFNAIKFNELGNAVSLSKINADDLFELYLNYYKDDNCEIAYYGPIRPMRAKYLVKNLNTNDILSAITFSELFKNYDSYVCSCSPCKNNLCIMCSYVFNDSNRYSFFKKMVFDYYMSSEYSFLWDSLRVNKGLVYNFGGGYLQFLNKAMIILYVETKKDNKNTIINLLQEIMKNFQLNNNIIKKDINKIIFNSLYLINELNITQTMIKDINLLIYLDGFLKEI